MQNAHNSLNHFSAVLFDLDGTLFDTAPDLAFALNQLCLAYNTAQQAFADIRPRAGHGSHALLKLAFNIEATHPNYSMLYEQYIKLYQTHMADSTQLFTGVIEVLNYLQENNIPWGIVTNKPQLLTMGLLSKLPLPYPPHCIICGDSLAKRKPHPEPILYACELLRQSPSDCVYIGDTEIDVIASKAAGTQSLVALYGYASLEEDPYAWRADGYIQQPIEIIDWLQSAAIRPATE